MTLTTAYPLLRVAVRRPWGGRRAVPRFGWEPPAGNEPVGEWWLASCRAGAVTPLVDGDGGQPLDAWLRTAGRARGLPAAADFPLLAKFLDSAELLSLQVHPDDAVARAAGLPCGKTEAWHVLAAEPGACVWLGLAPGHDVAGLLARLRAGADGEALRALLHRLEVRPGDTLLVPAGSVHAIGPGLLLYEIQQNSDTTWRLSDWGRGRPVQVEEAATALRDGPPPVVRRPSGTTDVWEVLADCAAFRLSHAVVERGTDLTPRGAFALLTCIAGHGRLAAPERSLPLRAGDTVLLLGAARLEGRGLVALAAEGPT